MAVERAAQRVGVASESSNRFASRDVPNVCGMVKGRRDHALAVGAERGALDPTVLSIVDQRREQPTSIGVPDLSIASRRDHAAIIWAELCARYNAAISGEHNQAFACFGIPNVGSSIRRSGDHTTAIRAEGRAPNSVRVPRKYD